MADEGLGIVVPARDEPALEAALERVLYDAEFAASARAAVARVRDRFEWSVVLAPLVDFVRDPHHAADYTGDRSALAPAASGRATHGLGHDIRMAWHHLVNSGPRAVTSRVRGRMTRKD